MSAQDGRILGLDLGSKRIGLALSDPELPIALPEGALRRTSLAADLSALKQLVQERGVVRVVVGLPIHMNGRKGPEALAAEAFARKLAEVTGVPVDLQDERWSSLEAHRTLRDTGHDARARKQHVDAVAASLILSSYLERRRSGS